MGCGDDTGGEGLNKWGVEMIECGGWSRWGTGGEGSIPLDVDTRSPYSRCIYFCEVDFFRWMSH